MEKLELDILANIDQPELCNILQNFPPWFLIPFTDLPDGKTHYYTRLRPHRQIKRRWAFGSKDRRKLMELEKDPIMDAVVYAIDLERAKRSSRNIHQEQIAELDCYLDQRGLKKFRVSSLITYEIPLDGRLHAESPLGNVDLENAGRITRFTLDRLGILLNYPELLPKHELARDLLRRLYTKGINFYAFSTRRIEGRTSNPRYRLLCQNSANGFERYEPLPLIDKLLIN